MKKGKNILVVEDDHEIQRMLNRTLELEGYQVNSAPDGERALELFQQAKPDLVILDIRMPGLNGFQVISLIRRFSDVPIIMLSGLCEVASLQKAISLGADDYIRKPFRAKELVARIRAKLRRAPGESHCQWN